MTKIHVPFAERSYDVIITDGDFAQYLPKVRKTLIVTDTNVAACGYAENLQAAFAQQGTESGVFCFPAGEFSKNIENYRKILEACAMRHLTGGDCLVALGGGVVGDLTGFAAATYRRGVQYYQLPTTLLAAVDSSVGGKTGVNLPAGKNLVGAFWQPSGVICDISAHKTLPQVEYANGLAEMLKYGVLWDAELFAALERGTRANESQIARCVALKRDAVVNDERDTGARRMLNLGHTLGHAIEQKSGYQIPHGAAVGLGILLMCKAFSPFLQERLRAALAANGLPTECKYSVEELFEPLSQDKKCVGGEITIVVPLQIGACELRTMRLSELKQRLEECQ